MTLHIILIEILQGKAFCILKMLRPSFFKWLSRCDSNCYPLGPYIFSGFVVNKLWKNMPATRSHKVAASQWLISIDICIHKKKGNEDCNHEHFIQYKVMKKPSLKFSTTLTERPSLSHKVIYPTTNVWSEAACLVKHSVWGSMGQLLATGSREYTHHSPL